MLSSKVNTQSWSKAPQAHDYKDGNWNYSAAQQEESTLKGSKAVGDELNAVVNPTAAKEKAEARKAKGEMGKDDFLKLMITQMKNQDPLNPMETHEMAAQLAQFTSLEQLFNVNKNLQGLQAAQDPMQKYQALNLLGKTIQSDSRYVMHDSSDKAHELRFDLGSDAARARVNISDEKGQVIKTIDYGNLKKGLNKVTWDATDKDDRVSQPGKYTFTVEATDGMQKKIFAKTETAGVITGVNYGSEGVVLLVGDQKVRLQDIQKIEDAGLKSAQTEREASSHVESQVKKDKQVLTEEQAKAANGGKLPVSEKVTATTTSLNGAKAPSQPVLPQDKPSIDLNALQTLAQAAINKGGEIGNK